MINDVALLEIFFLLYVIDLLKCCPYCKFSQCLTRDGAHTPSRPAVHAVWTADKRAASVAGHSFAGAARDSHRSTLMLSCDTSSAFDKATNRFNASTSIILYAARLGARADNYISFLINWSTGKHDCMDAPLRETDVSEETLQKLTDGRAELRTWLHGQFSVLLEDYLGKPDSDITKEPRNEKLIDRSSRLACDLHSRKLPHY